jgi:Fanconi anemia group M protein
MQTILKKKNQIVIFVDDREKNSLVFEHLKETDAKINVSRLNVGDYIVSDRVCVERKTSDDFVNSIIDGRLFKQAEELIDNFSSPVLIIEGNYFRESMNVNAIKAAKASMIVNYKIPILMTQDEQETAEMIYWLAKKDQVQNCRQVGIKGKKKPKTSKELLECVVAGYPGVSVVLSKRILEKFKTIEKFANASEEDLVKVDGIGKVLAKRIFEVNRKKYGK